MLLTLIIPVGSGLKVAAYSGSVLAALTLTGVALARGFGNAEGVWRPFWALLGGGTLLWFLGTAVHNGPWLLAQASPGRFGLTVQASAHAASYLALFCALAWLTKRVRKEMFVVDLLDALSVMMGSGLLLWCAVVGLLGHGSMDGIKDLPVFLRPAVDLGLSFLVLRALVTVHPPLAVFLVGGILVRMIFDV